MLPLVVIPLLHIKKNLLESFIDNNFREKVHPVIGSIVYCDLAFNTVEHTGIYVGENQIVHLDGSGVIEKVDPKTFLSRLNGLNTAMSIYVSCIDNNPVGNNIVGQRALSMVGKKRKYSLLSDNCHQFTAGCMLNNFENNYNLFIELKNLTKDYYNCNNFRVWDLNFQNKDFKLDTHITSLSGETEADINSIKIFYVEMFSIILHYTLNQHDILPRDILYFQNILKKMFNLNDISILRRMFELKRVIKKEEIETLLEQLLKDTNTDFLNEIRKSLKQIIEVDKKGDYSKYSDILHILHKLEKENK